jgi:hypothetical protein
MSLALSVVSLVVILSWQLVKTASLVPGGVACPGAKQVNSIWGPSPSKG